MANGDARLKDDGLTGIGVKAAQVLDIAVGPDPDFLLVGAEHGPVPNARPGSDRHGSEHDRAGSDPGLRVDGRNGITYRADHGDSPIPMPSPVRKADLPLVIIADAGLVACRGLRDKAPTVSSSGMMAGLGS
jgi:hypothetical protein